MTGTKSLCPKKVQNQQKQLSVQSAVQSKGVPGYMLGLQRQYGNRFAQRMVNLFRLTEDEAISIRRAPKESTAKLTELKMLLQDDEEKKAITLMGILNEDEVTTVLNSREYKELAIDSFNNKEMYSAMLTMGGDLYQSLQWMFDEGTDWEKVRNVISDARKGKEQVRADNWMKKQFVKICNDKEMIEAVKLLGSQPIQQVDWLAEEGVNGESIYRISIAPLSMPTNVITLYKALLALPRSYRDDIAYQFISNLSDEQVKMMVKNADGRRSLTLILAEIADGWTSGDEEKQRDRLMGLVESDGPDLAQVRKERETKAKAQQAHAVEANQLIDTHTSFLNLREEALAKDLLRRLPKDYLLVEQVLDTVGSQNRDDVSLALFQAATDEQIKAIAADGNGRSVLLRIIHELYKGDMADEERAEMQRAMKLISQVEQDKGASTEVEVITYIYGGSLDVLGVALAGGSKGHTAVSIGDRVYSFELGWSCGRTKDEYLVTNREKRDGIGQVLQIREKDARKIQAELDASCGKGAYAISGDICTDSSARALQTVLPNLKAGWNPQRFVGYLETTGAVKTHRFYPKSRG